MYKIDKLTTHSFIAKSQACYLKTRKAEMDDTSCLILLDFAENYHYEVQDEVWDRHWNKEQGILHPVVLYYKEDNSKCSALPCVSCLVMWNMILVLSLNCNDRPTCEYIKKALPNVTLLENFSDGCACQYKNFKTFLNLCYHSSNFGFVQSGASSLPVLGSHQAMDSGELSRDYFYDQAFRGP